MKKFYLGMDIGTDSVGMACTDEQYNLLRAKGKNLWAVRLFDEAKTAQDRRTKRAARRRLARRKQRINFLQEVFAPFIEDKLFFIRLNNSGFYEEDKDKSLKSKYSLFADSDFTDKDFHNQYKTIFHLRSAILYDNLNKQDLRLYYLALHHIIKYRGHFLFEGEGAGQSDDFNNLFTQFNGISHDLSDDNPIEFPIEKVQEFVDIALSDAGLNDKKKEANKLFGFDKDKQEWVNLILGAKVKRAVLFGEDVEGDSISFKELSEDEKFYPLQEELGDMFSLLEAARNIFNYIRFAKVLGGHKYVSDSMVAIYDKHKKDLQKLKAIIRNCPRSVYYDMFKSENCDNNYAHYITYTKSGAKKTKLKRCNIEDFYKFVKKKLEENQKYIKDEIAYQEILNDIEKGDFLPKIINADNGLFPHQINGAELDQILINLAKHFPEFSVKDDTGFSACEKIKKIFLFRIPYYVGPVNTAHKEKGGNAWAVRIKDGRITPWNFDEMIDKNKSNEEFMRRMTNKCTFLFGEDVLPKCSMYYQAYNVLNQINKLKINSKLISVQLKKEIFQNLYLKKKKVTKKDIIRYLEKSGELSLSEAKDTSLEGTDGLVELTANMSSYITLKNILGDFVDTNPQICEDIILCHTLSTDKKILEEYLLREYKDVPQITENIKQIKGISSFKDFGRFSLKFLTGIYGGFDCATGEGHHILYYLYNTQENLNEILNNDKYEFQKTIDEENGLTNPEISDEDIDGLYVSPAVRRGIRQALKMLDEYTNAVGRDPDKIFIEVTRKKEEKPSRKFSRKKQLQDLFDSLKNDCADITRLMGELNEKSDAELRSERLYLYFMQLGRCAYTGKIIDIGQLSTNLYDVDHIIPRALLKDDSLDNKVLVLREKNAQKSDTYPLPRGFTDQQPFWKRLKDMDKDHRLMSTEKYARLTRTEELTDREKEDFINRQLVFTNQTIKAVADLLKRKYAGKKVQIVYSKASLVKEFMHKFNLVKCRDTNDLHHAKDAYLNIVVGNIYVTKFPQNQNGRHRIDGEKARNYNLEKLFEKRVSGAWSGPDNIVHVKNVLSKLQSILVTRYAFCNKAEFYDETIYKKGGTGSVPRKNVFPYNQLDKYGGYSSLSTAYFAVVESLDKKGNKIKTIESVPTYYDYQIRGDKNKLAEYFKSTGLNEPVVLIPKLKIKTLVSINGFNGWIAGKTGKRILIHNANQWYTDSKTDDYINLLNKFLEGDKKGLYTLEEKNADRLLIKTNRFKEDKGTISKDKNLGLYNSIIDKLNLPCYTAISASKNFTEKLDDKKQEFSLLTLHEQVSVLVQIIKFMKCNAETVNLKLMNDGANCGKILFSKNITDVDFTIIHQSPCGLIVHKQKV